MITRCGEKRGKHDGKAREAVTYGMARGKQLLT